MHVEVNAPLSASHLETTSFERKRKTSAAKILADLEQQGVAVDKKRLMKEKATKDLNYSKSETFRAS